MCAIRKGITFNPRVQMKIFLLILIIFSTILLDVVFKFNLELSIRKQAKYNLEQTRFCVNELLLFDSKGNYVNYRSFSEDQLFKAIDTCARKMRTTETGDMFAFSLTTGSFIYDPSLDCFVEGGKKMTKESECSIHKNPKKCEEALIFLNSGYDSNDNHISWEFDDSPEYLEWVILPFEDKGFDGNKRGGIIKPNQVVLVQGSQEDEILKRYIFFTMTLRMISFVLLMSVLLLIDRECKEKLNEIKNNSENNSENTSNK